MGNRYSPLLGLAAAAGLALGLGACTTQSARTYYDAAGVPQAIVTIERVHGLGLVADQERIVTRRGAQATTLHCVQPAGTIGWDCRPE